MDLAIKINTFNEGKWKECIDVKDFVYRNLIPYYGDGSFLMPPSEKTQSLWKACARIIDKGLESINGSFKENIFGPLYIQKDLELIVGLITPKSSSFPWKDRLKSGSYIENPFIKSVKGFHNVLFPLLDPEIRVLESHGVFNRFSNNVIREGIVGDYRRMALYGIDRLIVEKESDKATVVSGAMHGSQVTIKENIDMQVLALKEIKKFGAMYGLDLSQPAKDSREAVQWVYMAYLASVNQKGGIPSSLGNVASFLDIFIERDLKDGLINESEAQELIDQLMIKLRLLKCMMPSNDSEGQFGRPILITEALGGQLNDGRTKVTKTAFRFLHTLYNLGPFFDPSFTILWSKDLPEAFKEFCVRLSLDTSSLQFLNDDLMRSVRGSDDYGIVGEVAYQEIGKRVRFGGMQVHLSKILLLTLNEGRDECSGNLLVNGIAPVVSNDFLDYDEILAKFKKALAEVARIYVKAMNILHFIYDEHDYEAVQMAFTNTAPSIDFAYNATGISFISNVLAAIKFAKTSTIKNENGLTVDLRVEGNFPSYGNHDDRVDMIAKKIKKILFTELAGHQCYKNAIPSLSLSSISQIPGLETLISKAGERKNIFLSETSPFFRQQSTHILSFFASLSKLDFAFAQDGISNTIFISPKSFGKTFSDQQESLLKLFENYLKHNGHHINLNIIDKEVLKNACLYPEKYPRIEIKVSGYEINFTSLSQIQQLGIIMSSFSG